MKRIALVVTLAVGLALGSTPANAGTLGWDDKKGDAFLVFQGVEVPGPSDDAFDLTNANITSTVDTVHWTTRVTKLAAGVPTGSTGYSFLFTFKYGGAQFYMHVTEDAQGARAFQVRQNFATGPDLACRACSATINRKDNTVSLKLPFTGLTGAVQSFDRKLPPIGPGAKLEALKIDARRTVLIPGVASFSPTADLSSPAGNAVFTV